uniref:Uncharacterized protein n=1 Tax=Oryza meridionalis TaxID=40149 RepID=A0A0E0CSR4_9ORYZ
MTLATLSEYPTVGRQSSRRLKVNIRPSSHEAKRQRHCWGMWKDAWRRSSKVASCLLAGRWWGVGRWWCPEGLAVCDTLERCNLAEGTTVTSPPSMVESSCENHTLVGDGGAIDVVTFLEPPLGGPFSS